VRPPEDARLPPEEDEEVKKLTDENRALRQQLAKRPDLVLTFADRATVLREFVPPLPPVCESDADAAVIAKRSEMLAQAQVRLRSRNAFHRPEDFSEAELEEYLARLREYLVAQQIRDDLMRRSATVELRL
jgi:hypothetical protein